MSDDIIKIACPRCGTTLKAVTSLIGRAKRCPQCRKRFTILTYDRSDLRRDREDKYEQLTANWLIRMGFVQRERNCFAYGGRGNATMVVVELPSGEPAMISVLPSSRFAYWKHYRTVVCTDATRDDVASLVRMVERTSRWTNR